MYASSKSLELTKAFLSHTAGSPKKKPDDTKTSKVIHGNGLELHSPHSCLACYTLTPPTPPPTPKAAGKPVAGLLLGMHCSKEGEWDGVDTMSLYINFIHVFPGVTAEGTGLYTNRKIFE